ncbi:MAG: PAS domain S-box protein [Elusimicrobia bacterium]|nr:PAS domain S-box protein [Elusimicrobiota bacterium]
MPAKKGARRKAAPPRPNSPALLQEGAFLALIDSSIKSRKETNLIVFHSVRLEEIRLSRGEAMAVQVLERLVEFVSAQVRPQERLGRLGSDQVAVLMTSPLATAQEAAQRIHQAVRETSRVPVSTGVAGSVGLDDGARGLWKLARQAAAEAWAEGARTVRTRTKAGPVPLPIRMPRLPASPAGSSIEARYQRLVLLNRMSLELFADRPFPDALVAASNVVLALMGSPYAAVYFCDDFGSPHAAQRHGDPLFLEPEAQSEEALVVAQALLERRIVTAQGTRLGWLAAPLSSIKGKDLTEDGVLVVGYPESRAPSSEKDQTMLEISRLLRNARLIQRNLQQQRVLAAVTEQSADAIIVTDLASRILMWNTSVERLTGYTKEDLLSRQADLLAPAGNREEQHHLEDAARASGSAHFESVSRRKDGGLVPIEGHCTLLKDDSGTPWGMVRVFRDITKRKELDRMKSEFVSLVSHELRTPLTAIQGFAETILDFGDGLEADKRTHFISIILEEAKRLGRLVTNFLDVSKLEAGAMHPKPRQVELSALCKRLVLLFKEHPSLAVFEEKLSPQASSVWADEDQVYRVLVNLCGNSLKYTPPKGTVTISSKPDGEFVEICVADQGPGIAEENRTHIFEKFFRVADTVSRKTPGTGLGLAICKGIVEAHGGRIWLESAPGRGTRFYFTLPAHP